MKFEQQKDLIIRIVEQWFHKKPSSYISYMNLELKIYQTIQTRGFTWSCFIYEILDILDNITLVKM